MHLHGPPGHRWQAREPQLSDTLHFLSQYVACPTARGRGGSKLDVDEALGFGLGPELWRHDGVGELDVGLDPGGLGGVESDRDDLREQEGELHADRRGLELELVAQPGLGERER